MTTRRPKISFPELEARGKHAILRSSEEVRAEEELLASQDAVSPETQHAGMPDAASTPERQQPGVGADLVKVTYRIRPEAFEAIEDAKRLLRRRYGIKASLEDIAGEALLAIYRDLLDNQHASTLVRRLSGDPETGRRM